MTDAQHVDGAALVVLGATGDLAQRKLYPALASLAQRGQLPAKFCLLGVARTEQTDEGFREECKVAVQKAHPDALDAFDEHVKCTKYVTGSFDDDSTWAGLRTALEACDRDHGTGGNRVFYLSTLPQFFETAVTGLSGAGLNADAEGGSTRIVIEKPFGHDLASARELNDFVHGHFEERQIFRIDHYLGKETVQNVLALRFANAIFEPIWDRRYIDNVQITIAESIGVEHRGTFYEQAGTVRDIVQNHAMQVLSLVTMEPPASFEADPVRDEKVKALCAVERFHPFDVPLAVVRGQYAAGTVDGVPVDGYRDEEGVAPDSATETYIAIRFGIDNWRWAGVPFYLRAGKRLAKRTTEVALRFKSVPHLALPTTAIDSIEPNTLVLRIQPDEGVRLEFAAKVPGSGFAVRTVGLDFSYREGFREVAPEAYERLLLDVMHGDATLFIREDEVDVAWKIVQPILDAISGGSLPVHAYNSGTWGPSAADAILDPRFDQWRTP
ncbi:MAG TPA: glucose-6-phosphate dehydrogenase [Acidimicrobiia bacterium]